MSKTDTRTGFEKFEDILREAEADATGREAPKAKRKPIRFAPFTDPDPRTIEPRDWLYDKHYIRKFLSADIAPGGTIKTSNALIEAMVMATCVDLLDVGDARMPPRPLRVVYWTGEDTLDEIIRRQAAGVKYYWGNPDRPGEQRVDTNEDGMHFHDKTSRALLRQNLFLASGRELPIKIVTGDSKGGFKIAEPLIEALTAALIRQRIDVLQIDPFIDSHEGISENDNAAIQSCAAQWRKITEAANVSINLSHHSRKGRSGGSKEIDSDDARGASALRDACRSVRVFNVMDDDDATKYGIDIEDRFQFVNVANGKPNMAKRSSLTGWRKIVGVDLGNARMAIPGEARGKVQDNVGVVAAWSPPVKSAAQQAGTAALIVAALLDVLASGKRITRQQGGDYTIKDCVAILRRKDINATVDQIREALDAACDGPEAVLEYYRRGGEATYRRRAKVEE